MLRHLLLVTLLTIGLLAPAATATAGGRHAELRVATFNASLNRATAGQLVTDLAANDDDERDPQVRAVAEIIQRTRPDVLLVNEFDHDPDGIAADLLRENFLEVGWNGQRPIRYRYAYAAPSNTGIASGFDLNDDGISDAPVGTPGYADDAFGFGDFPGQYGMLVLSRYPIVERRVRTFQLFRWADMPGNLIPTDFYSEEEQAALRLSSKSHWDVPVRTPAGLVHLLAAHPTPPVFDGDEDRNGRRNHDEIRFWADYVSPRWRDSRYIYDDDGRRGGLHRSARFVIVGDYNADPCDGDSIDSAASQLLDAPLVRDPMPTSDGGVWAAETQGLDNLDHECPPALDTADFGETPFGPGNLRADYVLPSRGLKVSDAGIFWPTPDEDGYDLTGPGFPAVSSDHRLVWVDLRTARSHHRR